MKRSFLLFLALAACGTPQEQCINTVTRDLRVVDQLIAETQTNLNRGYALEDVTTYRPVWRDCGPPPAPKKGEKPQPPRLCLDDEAVTVQRPQAIDLDAESHKLATLQAKRKQLANQAEASVNACRTQYPAP